MIEMMENRSQTDNAHPAVCAPFVNKPLPLKTLPSLGSQWRKKGMKDPDLSMRRRWQYLLAAGSLFVVLVFIAIYVHDPIIRPYVGDLLAVICLYFLVRGATGLSRYWTASAVFVLSAIIEYAQMLQLLSWLGLSDVPIVRIILGSTPDPLDLVLYATGILIVLLVDRGRKAGN
jgi:hypothetical protein